MTTWLVAVAVGAGSEASAPAWALHPIHRFVGPVQRLDTPRAVLLTLTLGALLACTIAPALVSRPSAAELLSAGQARSAG